MVLSLEDLVRDGVVYARVEVNRIMNLTGDRHRKIQLKFSDEAAPC